ncbi:chitobiase/beta-hexosaminidase C-terminal domain-containing protein [Bacillus massiliigorillae]|uniref:chitobiase/beta-hexosaminidase C-terminal domain-containing protein n=1 Tax=Bacillus massiliigorillae TaxID=1243664 RepID=UPI0003A6CE7E|nr:chitobiase/beta-hexosaminidase C-terminal domain-containing protein [Bacillus massiliigorillae]
MDDYRSLLQIRVTKEDVTVLGQEGVPTPETVTAANLEESKEATLLTFKNVKIESVSSGNFTAIDENGKSFMIRPQNASILEVGKTYDVITGVLSSFNDVYQLIPRDVTDVIEDATKVQPVEANPGSGFVKEGQEVTLTSNTAGATIYYTTDGSEPTTSSTAYTKPITVSEAMTVKAIAVKEGLTSSPMATFTYTIQTEDIRIHDIQGASHTSPLNDLNVNDVEGIVTHVVDKNSFYMQDQQPDNDDNTSEAILVNKTGHNLKTGDVIEVTGEVQEIHLDGYAEKTETDLTATSIAAQSIEKTATGQDLPESVVLGKDRKAPTEIIDNDSFAKFDPEEDGIDFFESLEGMLVEVENPKVVAPQSYGDVVVLPKDGVTNTTAGGLKITETDYNPERITIGLNDKNFVVKAGDSFDGSITGVMSYSFSNYKVLTDKTKLPKLIEGTTAREITSIQPTEDKLTIATYNVENFSAATDDEKITKIAQSIIDNLKTPDIIQLTEVQDGDGPADSGNSSADETYKVLIKKIAELGGPTYSFTDIAPENNKDGGAPGGNIRVGFLYNAERGVTLTDGIEKGTATEAVSYDGENLSLNPGRIDPTNEAFNSSRKPLAAQFEFNGEKVILVANHYNSKGGDQPLFGINQPAILKSEVQRNQIATIVNGFVKDIKAKNKDANVVLLGDFNDFEFSNPLKITKGTELTNMIEKVPFEKRYTYSYQGNSQVLDHILVSNNMTAATTVDIVHINSSFMEKHGRASDHDPVLIQTKLAKAN